MKKITFILLCFFTTLCYSQKVKKIIVRFDKSKQISESYFVLKADKKIKQGEYVSYFRLSDNNLQLVDDGEINMDDYIKQKGNYSDGKKEGDWIENISYLKGLKGKYKDGKKIGIWNTYNNGEKISSFDYDNNKKVGIWLTFKEEGEVVERFDYTNNIQLPPIIRINLEYPESAIENETQGTVKVSFHINKDCSIDNLKIIHEISPECDKAALKGMKRYAELLKKYGQDCEDKIEEMNLNFKLY